MAVGITSLPFLDAETETRSGLFGSSNASENGDLAPFVVLGAPGLDAFAKFGEGDVDDNTFRVAQGTRRKNYASLSSQVTTGGTAVTINPASYTFLTIINPSDATESLFLRFDGGTSTNSASADFELGAGASLTFGANGGWPMPTDSISINAASDAHLFTAFGA